MGLHCSVFMTMKTSMTMTMAKPCWGYLSFVILLLAALTLSVAEAADSSTHDTFLKCLAENTKVASAELSKIVFAQNNSSFTTILYNLARNKRYRTAQTPKPVLIVTPLKEIHIQGTVICAKTAKLHIRTRSGGHDYEGVSYASKEPFILLDMFNFKAVTVDVKNEVAVVQAGATLGEVYYRIWEKSKVHGFPAGVCPTVGAGGHISGAGYGSMVRKYGLTVDNLIDAKIVDANGNLLDKKSMGEDLFWAIRGGGGGSFGVIVSFTIKIVPVPEKVTVFRVEKTLETKVSAADLLVQWQKVAPTTDNRLFMRVLLQLANSAVQKGKMTGQASIVALFLGGVDEVVSLMGKEFPLLGLTKENCSEVSWIQSVLWWNNGKSLENGDKPEILLNRNLNASSFMKRKSDFVEKAISKEGLETIFQTMVELKSIGLVFNPYGGTMDEISSDATPFPWRKGTLFKIQYSVSWDDPSPTAAQEFTGAAKKLHSVMTPYVSSNPRGAYLNYRDLDIGVNNFGPNSFEEGKTYGTKFFGKNFDRLVNIKTKVDPENFFRNEQSIPVRPSKA